MTGLRPATLLATLFMVAASFGSADAHTVAGRTLDGKAAITEFRFAGGEPMAYAQVKVFAPDATEPFQVGHADGAGRFAFVPDRAGEWRVEAREEAENHGARLLVSVSPDASVSVQLNRFWRAVLWTSIATNLVLVVVMLSRRRQSAAADVGLASNQ
jgi:nickel transport protein